MGVKNTAPKGFILRCSIFVPPLEESRSKILVFVNP